MRFNRKNRNNKRLIVIGAGLGGLTSAIIMQAPGYEVLLFEETNQIGGKASVFKIDELPFIASTYYSLLQENDLLREAF